MLRPELAHDPEMARRFLREAYAAQAVRSAGVARVLGAQTEGGRPWIATEFLVGPTLDQAVERHGRARRTRRQGARRGARDDAARDPRGRSCAPRPQAVEHRADLRGPRIIDFGIARPEHGLTLTTTGQTLATPGYAAPEQVLGRRTGPARGRVLAGRGPGIRGGRTRGLRGRARGRRAVPSGARRTGTGRGAGGPAGLVGPCLAKEAADRPALDALAGQLAPPRGAARIWRTGPLAEDIARREMDARRMATMPGDEPSGPSRRRLLTTLAAGGAVLAAGGGAGAWWLLGDDEAAADGTQPWDAKPLAKYDEGTAPSPLWGPVDLGSLKLAGRAVPDPLPVRDLVVVAVTDGRLRGYGVTDGKPRWTTSTTGLRGRLLALRDEGVLATDAKGVVRMLSAKDGTPLWKAEDADAAALLAVDDRAVYVVTRAGRVRAVGLDSHRPLWTAPVPVRSSGDSPAAAAVAGGRLVVYGTSGEVVALDTRNGRTVWGPDKRGSTPLPPVIVGDTVYLGGRSLAAVTLRDGKEKWARAAVGESGCSAPAVRKGVVYAVDGTDLSHTRLMAGRTCGPCPSLPRTTLWTPRWPWGTACGRWPTRRHRRGTGGGRPAGEGGMAVHRGYRRQLAAGSCREPRLPAAQPDADSHAGVLGQPSQHK